MYCLYAVRSYLFGMTNLTAPLEYFRSTAALLSEMTDDKAAEAFDSYLLAQSASEQHLVSIIKSMELQQEILKCQLRAQRGQAMGVGQAARSMEHGFLQSLTEAARKADGESELHLLSYQDAILKFGKCAISLGLLDQDELDRHCPHLEDAASWQVRQNQRGALSV